MKEIKRPGLVSFATQTSKDNMINATAMAKSFDKRPADWLRLNSTKNFLSGLSIVRNIPVAALVVRIKKTSKDGRAEGVWIHEDATLEFARWLSPSFAIWNNRHTRELLLNGKTEAKNVPGSLPALATDLLQRAEFFDNGIDEQIRKALYHDTVLQSRTLIPVTIIAKELGMSAVALNKWLHEKKIIFINDTRWLLYADYQGKGYTGTKTALYIDSQGRYQSNIHTYWTEKGREFIHALLCGTKQIA